MFKVYESTVNISSRYDQLLEENRSLDLHAADTAVAGDDE
jgi:hypothetical protein